MKLGNLKNFDSSMQIITGEDELSILGITDNFLLTFHHFVFIKNNKFLTDWLEKTKQAKRTGIIFDKNFFTFFIAFFIKMGREPRKHFFIEI